MITLTLSRAQYEQALAAVRAEGATIASVALVMSNMGFTFPEQAASLVMAGRVKVNG